MLLCISGVRLLDFEGEPARGAAAKHSSAAVVSKIIAIRFMTFSARQYPWRRFVSPAPCHALNTVLRLSLENLSRWERPGPATNLQERTRSLPKRS
jgi:hypothetical protein